MERTVSRNRELGGLIAWLTIGCGALFYSYQFIVRVFPNVMRDELIHAFKIDAEDFGAIISCYDWAYFSLQIPLGLIMDRFGPKKLIGIAALTCSIGCFLFATTTNVYIAALARFFMGMGSACGFIGTLKLGTLWFAPNKLGQVIALTLAFGTLGAALGGRPLSMLINNIGWNNTLLIMGMGGIAISGLVFFYVQNSPTGEISHEIAPEHKQIFKGLLEVIASKQAWVLSLFSMLMYVPLTVWGVAWGVVFVEQACSVSQESAADVMATMFYGAAVGGPIFVALSDFLKRRKTPMYIGCFVAFFIHLFIVFYQGVPLAIMHALFFLVGFTYTSKGLSFASICEIMPKERSGVALGFMNSIVMLNGVILHPLIGKLLVLYWDGSKNSVGDPIYATSDYRLALSVVPICLVMSIVLMFLMKETHPGKSQNL